MDSPRTHVGGEQTRHGSTDSPVRDDESGSGRMKRSSLSESPLDEWVRVVADSLPSARKDKGWSNQTFTAVGAGLIAYI